MNQELSRKGQQRGAAVICASTNQVNSLTEFRDLVDDTSAPPGLILSQKAKSIHFYRGAKPLHSNTEVSPFACLHTAQGGGDACPWHPVQCMTTR